MEVFSSHGFLRHPEVLYTMGRALTQSLLVAEPTSTHLFLAALEKLGKLKTVVTQNVDGLHQKAGSTDVIELHGNMKEAHCLKCQAHHSMAELEAQMLSGSMPPKCRECGGLVKPDVVLFGDPLPLEAFQRAVTLAAEADIMLTLGSSLVVSPASELPAICQQGGGKLIIINLQSTWYDPTAAAVLHEPLREVMEPLLELAQGGKIRHTVARCLSTRAW